MKNLKALALLLAIAALLMLNACEAETAEIVVFDDDATWEPYGHGYEPWEAFRLDGETAKCWLFIGDEAAIVDMRFAETGDDLADVGAGVILVAFDWPQLDGGFVVPAEGLDANVRLYVNGTDCGAVPFYVC